MKGNWKVGVASTTGVQGGLGCYLGWPASEGVPCATASCMLASWVHGARERDHQQSISSVSTAFNMRQAMCLYRPHAHAGLGLQVSPVFT